MNETLAQIDFEAQFNEIASQLGGFAVTSQIDRPMPDLPPLTEDEIQGFVNQLEAVPQGLPELTEEEIDRFTAQLENDELEGYDKVFFEESGLTAAQASDEALRAEEANRRQALAFYGAREQAAIGDNLRHLHNTTDDEDEEERPSYRRAV